jgi:hypothetical protein
MKQLIGYLLVAAPFVVIVGWMFADIGLLRGLAVLGGCATIIGSIAAGFWLLGDL